MNRVLTRLPSPSYPEPEGSVRRHTGPARAQAVTSQPMVRSSRSEYGAYGLALRTSLAPRAAAAVSAAVAQPSRNSPPTNATRPEGAHTDLAVAKPPVQAGDFPTRARSSLMRWSAVRTSISAAQQLTRDSFERMQRALRRVQDVPLAGHTDLPGFHEVQSVAAWGRIAYIGLRFLMRGPAAMAEMSTLWDWLVRGHDSCCPCRRGSTVSVGRDETDPTTDSSSLIPSDSRPALTTRQAEQVPAGSSSSPSCPAPIVKLLPGLASGPSSSLASSSLPAIQEDSGISLDEEFAGGHWPKLSRSADEPARVTVRRSDPSAAAWEFDPAGKTAIQVRSTLVLSGICVLSLPSFRQILKTLLNGRLLD